MHDHEEGGDDDDKDKDLDIKQKSQRRETKSLKEEAKGSAEKMISDEEESESDQAAMALSPDIAKRSFKPPEKVYTKRSRKKAKEKEAPSNRGGKQMAVTRGIAPAKPSERARRG